MKYYITNDLAVQARYTINCGDVDGRIGDILYVAPSYDEPGAHIVFAGTNGDPVYLACLDDDGGEDHRAEDDWAQEGWAQEAIDTAIEAVIGTLLLSERVYRPFSR